MQRTFGVLATAMLVAGATVFAFANPTPPETPSERLGIELELAPASQDRSSFLVRSVVTDLATDRVIANPQLVIATDKPGRIEAGVDGKWMLQMQVAADAAGQRAIYEATFSREGKIISKQRVSINLKG